MSIPLYYALNWKEFVNFASPHRAQIGFGFSADGTAVTPREQIPGAPAMINDAVLPQELPDGRALDRLAEYCGSGCVFDFERDCTPVHLSILQGLRKRLPNIELFALPQAFSGLVSKAQVIVRQPVPCNHWEAFCAEQEQKYGSEWILELQPWMKTVTPPLSSRQEGNLQQSLCFYEQVGQELTYYDKKETIEEKIKKAEQYKCSGVIALYVELKNFIEE